MTVTTILATALAPLGLLSLSLSFRPIGLLQRLANLRRTALLMAGPILGLGIAVMVTGRAPMPRAQDAAGGTVPQEWYMALQDAQQDQLLAFGSLTFAVAALLVQAARLLDDLRSFTTRHESDLTTREQIELARGRG